MISRFHKVDDGIFRGSAPSPDDVQFLKDNYGVKKVISLDKETGEEIQDACRDLGMEHVMIPLDETRRSLLNLLGHDLEKLLKGNGPVFFHCHHGKDRTGLLTALYRTKLQGQNPEKALKEAYSLGFGVECSPDFIDLYEGLIRTSKKNGSDENEADIVSNVREWKSDNRAGVLEEAHQGSFAPFESIQRKWPYTPVYNELMEQSPTRDNLNDKPIFPHSKKKDIAPMVGQYNNATGLVGVGPSYPQGGFISD